MQWSAVVVLLCAVLLAQPIHAANWAFLVSSGDADTSLTNTMEASVCRLYHELVNNGVAKDHIILMMSDYFATAKENPLPGTLYDMPNGTDVYAGCVKDYVGKDVNIAVYEAVLAGDSAAVKGIGTGRVLAVTKSDNVYVYFNNHGGPGAVYFPGWKPYTVDQNQAALTSLNKRAGHSLVTMMACESGSMFMWTNVSNSDALVGQSSSDYDTDSSAAFCGNFPIGNTTYDGCLTSEFEAALVQDLHNNPSSESVNAQFSHIDLWMENDQTTAGTGDVAPPVLFGSASDRKNPVSQYFGKKKSVGVRAHHGHSSAHASRPSVWLPADESTPALHCAVAAFRSALSADRRQSAHVDNVAAAGAAMLDELQAHMTGRSNGAATCSPQAIMSTVSMRDAEWLHAYVRYVRSKPTEAPAAAETLRGHVTRHVETARVYGTLARKLSVELYAEKTASMQTSWPCVRSALTTVHAECDNVIMDSRYVGTLVNACVAHSAHTVRHAVRSVCA